MDVATFESLSAPTGIGADTLAAAVAGYGTEDDFALGARLRRSAPAELVAAALTQAHLRLRARTKFGDDADRMFFTRDGYEQATRRSVADHRAQRIVTTLGSEAHVLDLCCGIGADLTAMARAGATVDGVEVDPLTAAVARANTAVLGLADHSTVRTADAIAANRSGYAAVTCDPARRTSRGRVFDPDAYAPPWNFVLDLLKGTACVKVAPGIPHERVPRNVEAEWVSDDGEVKEAALWSGGLTDETTRRRATLLPTGATMTDSDDPGPEAVGVSVPGRYLYEPDGAVIRAGLVTAVAAAIGGWLIDSQIAYVSADRPVPTPFARRFEVVETLPYDVAALRRYVREHRIGTITVKKRGVGIEPERLRRQLRPSGPHEATFVVTRVAEKATVLVVHPTPGDNRGT